MKKVYILTNVLPVNYGGRTKSLLQRADILARAGYDVEILFTGYEYHHPRKFKELYSNKIIPKKVKLRSMLFDLQNDTEGAERYSFDYLKDYQNIGSKYYNKDNIECYRIAKDDYANIKYIDELNSDGKRKSRKYIDCNGNLIRMVTFTKKNEFASSKFLNTDGSVYLESFYGDVNGKHDVIKYNYTGKYKHTSGDFNIITYWLEQIIGNEDCNIITDARRLDPLVLDASLSNALKTFVMHSTHFNAKKSKSNTIRPIYRPILGLGKNENCQVIALTDEQVQDIKLAPKYGGVKLEVIGHPIFKKNNFIFHVPKRLIIVSRLVDNKQVIDGIKAFKIFHEQDPSYYLDIYGSGEEKENILEYIEQENLSKIVNLKGYTKDPSKEYAKAKGIIITSKYEGFGMTIIEANIQGCPVASYQFKYGQKDLITEGVNGFVAEENTPESLAIAISKMVNNLTNRKHIKKAVVSFNEENIVKKWESILK